MHVCVQGKYAWLRGDHKWLLEIRRAAGGENGRKMMYKVIKRTKKKIPWLTNFSFS
jgi:hypothetical protein